MLSVPAFFLSLLKAGKMISGRGAAAKGIMLILLMGVDDDRYIGLYTSQLDHENGAVVQ